MSRALEKDGGRVCAIAGGGGSEVWRASGLLAERYACPMHPDIRRAQDSPCPKCGMALDQKVVLMPTTNETLKGNAVRATIEAGDPLEVGKKASAVLHLQRVTGEPVILSDLIETHTKKIDRR